MTLRASFLFCMTWPVAALVGCGQPMASSTGSTMEPTDLAHSSESNVATDAIGGSPFQVSASDESASDGVEALTEGGPADSSGGGPRIVIEDETYDFGIMKWGETQSHSFTVRNEGSNDLKLTEAGTSCKCTLVDMPEGLVPPGGSREVRLEWEGQEPTENFRHGAVLHTNDPSQPTVRLTVTGKVRVEWGVNAGSIVLDNMLEGQPSEARVVVYSQTRDQVEIEEVHSDLSALTWKVVDATPEELSAASALAGKAIVLTYLPPKGHGPVRGVLSIVPKSSAKSSGGPTTKAAGRLDVQIAGRVSGHFGFIGKGFNDEGVLELGEIRQSEGAHRKVYLVVRGEWKHPKVLEVRVVRPDFLSVKVEPVETLEGAASRYRVEIDIPAGSPVGGYGPKQWAEVEIVTDHPITPVTRLRLAFFVVGRGGNARQRLAKN